MEVFLRMKKTVSVRELREYLTSRHVNSVVYYTENQRWYNVLEPCKIMMSFPVILIFENPNLVYLKSGKQTILFDRVKSAQIDTDTNVFCTIVTLFCGDFGTDGYDYTYTLLVE